MREQLALYIEAGIEGRLIAKVFGVSGSVHGGGMLCLPLQVVSLLLDFQDRWAILGALCSMDDGL